MADDLKKRGAADRRLVNIHQKWERVWWSKKFGCTEMELVLAGMTIGVDPKLIAATLDMAREVVGRKKRKRRAAKKRA